MSADYVHRFDVIWHGGMPTDGTTKGGLLAPRDERRDHRWALLDSLGGPGAFKDGSMQTARKRIMAKGAKGTFSRTVVAHREPFRERARAECAEADARRVALCKRWTGRGA